MTRPVVLHVGTPKSGTTSLQRTLARHRTVLGERDVLYPGDRPSHFLEALSLRDAGFGGQRVAEAEGAWDRMVAEVAAADRHTIVSHEMLGGAGRRAVRRAVDSLAPRPVRVVLTCRDLARQLPAVWQEGVKNGDDRPFTQFLEQTLADWDGPDTRRGAWAGQNLLGVTGRWAEVVGAERVTLVTVPPQGPPDELWQRFVAATGLPDLDWSLPDQPRNRSMGAAEAELLRRLGSRLPDDLPWEERHRVVRRALGQRRLAGTSAYGPLAVPEHLRASVDAIAAEVREGLVAAGYCVVGDLEDLTPRHPDGRAPDQLDDAALLDVALDLVVPLVLERERSTRPAAGPRPGPSAGGGLLRRALRRARRR